MFAKSEARYTKPVKDHSGVGSETKLARLPKAVQMQEDRANQILESMKANMQRSPNEPSEPEESIEDNVEEVAGEEVVEEISNPVIEEPVARKPEKEDRENDPGYWKHRLQTAQGIFDAEKSRLKEQLSRQSDEIETLKKSMKALEKSTAKRVDLKEILSEEEIEALGEDNLKIISRIAEKKAEEAASSYIKDLIDEKIAPVERQLRASEQSLLQERENAFWGAISSSVENWKAVNSDPEFLSWLQVRDTFSGGKSRLEVLQAAQTALDSSTVIAIFKAFLGSKKPVPTPKNKSPSPEGIPTGPTAPSKENVMMTSAEVKAFYDRVNRGFYRNRPAEMEAMEKKINMAYAAGLIR